MARAKELRADEPVECDAIRYGQRSDVAGWLLGLRILAWTVGGFFAIGGLLGGQLHLLIGLLPAAALQLVAQMAKHYENAGGGEVRVDEQALYLDGERRAVRIDRKRLRWGAARGKEVDFETREGRRITVQLCRRKDAARLLEATGTSVAQRAIVLPLRAQIGPFVTGLLVFMALTPLVALLAVWSANALALSSGAKALMSLLIPALGVALSLAMVKHLARPTVTIGIDGILVRRRLRRRFIPYASIAEVKLVKPTPGGTSYAAPVEDATMIPTLQLRVGNELVDLPIVGWSDEDVRRARSRIEEARAAADEEAVAPTADLARRDESFDAWRVRLRRLLSGDADFRQRRLTLDDIQQILADPKVPLSQRVGAALAVRAVQPEGAAERVRFAAEAAADGRVRIALLATLGDDDGALEAALAEAEESPSASEAASRPRASG